MKASDINRETVKRLRIKASEIASWVNKFAEYKTTKKAVEDFGKNRMVLAQAANYFKTENEACHIPSYELVRLFVN